MNEMCAGTYVLRMKDGTTRELFTCRDYPDQWRRMSRELLVLNRMRRQNPTRTVIGPERPTGEPVRERLWGHD